MVDQQLIDYLKERTKGKLLMSPEQLAEEIGIPAKQQSKLRKEGRFPIPFKNIGRLVYYSIYDVAIESVSLNLKYPFGLSLSKPCAALRQAQRERFK